MADTAKVTLAPAEVRSTRAPSRAWRRFRRSRLAVTGAALLVMIIAAAVTAPWITAHDPEQVEIIDRLKPPAWSADGLPEHPLGTDAVGRDMLSRMLYGARLSLLVGVASVLVGGSLGTLLGLIAGYRGRLAGALIMRVTDVQLAFPSVLWAIAIMAVIGPSFANVVLVLAWASWPTYCRIAHGQTLSLREREMVEAARALSATDARIMVRHILPNLVGPLTVVASFGVATNIINAASLSFLGVGIPPSLPTWGGMLAEGRDYLRTAWWATTFPGLALMATVFGVNVLGDWLRDTFDPRMRVE